MTLSEFTAKHQPNDGLPGDFIRFWKTSVSRRNRPADAYRLLLVQLEFWRDGDPAFSIPGYSVPPEDAQGLPHPRRWSYRNLRRFIAGNHDLKSSKPIA